LETGATLRLAGRVRSPKSQILFVARLKLRWDFADRPGGGAMVDWSIFAYGLPAALGVLLFLKAVADRLEWIEGAVERRSDQIPATGKRHDGSGADAGEEGQ
jgi:hypothetical protein